jgi:bidirectional [NiFe] hydrogenase diaphorase subunit
MKMLNKIINREATLADLDVLEDICRMTAETSLCGLGKSAPNPVLSSLRYFRQEYLDRITESGPAIPVDLPVKTILPTQS